ncbi:MAG: ABC transporter ATP-binding protein [Planctomycetes bacterium]|nr:ABC transporter ATP-binding protein [Planctomycetota bacterium]
MRFQSEDGQAVTQPVLEIENLTVRAGDRIVLRDLNLSVEPGSIIGLSGPSGCGKTTLLRTLAGLIDAEDGSISLRTRDSETPWVLAANSEPPDWPTFRRHMVLQQQRAVMIDDATVRENLRLPLRFRSHAPAPHDNAGDWDHQAGALMAQFGLSASLLKSVAGTLSVGEQQRISLIRALLIQPEALLLDEPTSALDADSVTVVESVISALARDRGLAVVVVSHDRDQLNRWCTDQMDLASCVVSHAPDNSEPVAAGVGGRVT